jgi:tRNA (adenine57-N1/adenine58-N1)-methyltransferase catalytic subunit
MKILISIKTGIYYYYKEQQNQDFHSKEGTIKKEDILSGNKKVSAHTGREFLVFDANDYDYSQKIKRGPQIITPKDLGYIAARTGISKNSHIVEAGGGSGGATIFFSKIAKSVKTYEIKPENTEIIKKNLETTKSDNVELILGDLCEHIEKEQQEIDLLFLDMPEPSQIILKNLSKVKSGHYIVCYLPSITQIAEVIKTCSEKKDLYFEEISEIILRHWRVTEKIARPEFRKDIDHTAFLIFIRKI